MLIMNQNLIEDHLIKRVEWKHFKNLKALDDLQPHCIAVITCYDKGCIHTWNTKLKKSLTVMMKI